MGRISGYYEWDDDHLTPGQKKEGGLHQNLFDADGKLKGSARFIPDDGDDDAPETIVVTETVYVPAPVRRRTREEEILQQAIEAAVQRLVDRGIEAAKQAAGQLWRETGRRALDTALARRRERREFRRARKQARVEVDRPADLRGLAEPRAPESGEVVGEDDGAVEVDDRPDMSRAEAQARYLAAIAAKAFSDEQMRLVTGANIIDADGLGDLRRSLGQLPADQVRLLLEAMVTNPSMLGEDALAELASVLGLRRRLGPA